VGLKRKVSFISSFLEDKSLAECIRRGQATSVIKIQGLGAQTPLPTKQEVNEFLHNFNHDSSV